MSEEQNNTQPEGSVSDSDKGNEPKELSIIERANAAREGAEKVLQELRAENDRKERLMAEERLAGTGGRPQVQQPKEETPKEYMDKVMSGKVKNEW